MNTFGQRLRLTTFGESHGPAIGGILDGMPSCVRIDFRRIEEFMDRRAPGKKLTSRRREKDKVDFLSGISPEGVTLGTPIGFAIYNTDARSSDYSAFESAFRPNHADYTYQRRYGIRDWRGGGRASARETANWVAAGALASHLTESAGISVTAWISGIGASSMENPFSYCDMLTPDAIYKSAVRCPVADFEAALKQEVEDAIGHGDSVGGRVSCRLHGVPAGLGEPVFGKLHARLAEAMMSINAAKGFEYGLGFGAAASRGKETADRFMTVEKNGVREVECATNFSGGIQGGISNGMDICFSVAFKPTPTFSGTVETIDSEGNSIELKMSGRHDPCVAIRAVPVVEAMSHLVLADMLLLSGSDCRNHNWNL